MEGTMDVLAQTGDDIGIEKLSQFMREIHTIIISVAVAAVYDRRLFTSALIERRYKSKDRNNIAYGNKFLHPRGVPVGGADAPVTGCATDRFRLVRSVNTNMRFAQAHPQNTNRIIRSGWQDECGVAFDTVIQDAFIMAKNRQSRDAYNFPHTDGCRKLR